MKITEKQYNNFNNDYSKNRETQDNVCDTDFYQMFDFKVQGKKILDIGCGNGDDLKRLQKQGAEVFGIEPSEEFVREANLNIGKEAVIVGVGEDLPYVDSSFDIVISKYAIQTSTEAKKCIDESARVLVSGGILHFLIKHPFRQFLEKKKYSQNPVNYFKQEIIKSVIYDGLIELAEPTHTMEDYLNKDFFGNFELIDYRENFDFPASEQIDDDIYPTYFVLTARRK